MSEFHSDPEAENLYQRLGIEPDADADTIKSAWRAAARRHHPDRPDGSTQNFQRVQEAYEALKDDAIRARYDQTGTIQEDPIDREATLEIQRVFLGLIPAVCDGRIGDPVEHIRDKLKSWADTEKRKSHQIQKEIDRLQAAEHFQSGGRRNLFQEAIDHAKNELTARINEAKHKATVMERAIDILEDYSYSGPKRMPINTGNIPINTGSIFSDADDRQADARAAFRRHFGV